MSSIVDVIADGTKVKDPNSFCRVTKVNEQTLWGWILSDHPSALLLIAADNKGKPSHPVCIPWERVDQIDMYPESEAPWKNQNES